MTYQRDPEHVADDAIVQSEDAKRRDKEIARANAQVTNGFGLFPAALTVAILIVGGYLVYSSFNPPIVAEHPSTTVAPQTTVPAPVPAVRPTAPEAK